MLFKYLKARVMAGCDWVPARVSKRAVARLANWAAVRLKRVEQRLSDIQKKLVLFAFCVVGCGLLAAFVFRTLSGGGSYPVVWISRMSLPRVAGRGVRLTPAQASIDPLVYGRVEHFIRMLDSLRIHDEASYVAICRARPHLIDSLHVFEKIYLKQSTKSLWKR